MVLDEERIDETEGIELHEDAELIPEVDTERGGYPYDYLLSRTEELYGD